MEKNIKEFLQKVVETLEDENTKVKIIINDEEGILKDELERGRMATVLRLLESLSDDFSNSFADFMSAVDAAVKGASIVGLKTEMVEDINALFNHISEDEIIRLKIEEK